MIKGTLQERLDYGNFVRSLKDHIVYPFLNIDKESRKIRRCYRIKVLKDKRNYDTDEIRIMNLMCLVAYAARIGGLVYTWLWRERIPEIILTMPFLQPEWWVSAEEMANIFLHVPAKVLETTLLKSETDSNAIGQALKAHQTENLDALVKIISNIPLDKIFGAFKLINAQHQIWEDLSKFSFYEESSGVIRYNLSDIFDIFTFKFSQEGESINNTVTVLDRLSEYENLDIMTDTRKLLLELCMGLWLACDLFKEELGVSDPITQTMQSIIDEPTFQKIFHMYVQFPRDKERCDDLLKRIIRLINELFGSDMTEDELDIEASTEGKVKLISFENSKRLDFPTRISKNESIDLSVKVKILDGLFDAFGHNFESYDGRPITKEEFVYLFDGPGKRPDSYKTPYYWNQDSKKFAGLLRLLYFGQQRGVDKIILPVLDKEKEVSSKKWSSLKQGLGKTILKPIEEQIQKVVFQAIGNYLPEVDLTKQNKPKHKREEHEKAKS